jgi:hypothetical protein
LNPLFSEALDSNRRGQLTATQRDGFADLLQQRNRYALGIAGALLAVAALVGIFATSRTFAVWRIAIVVVALGIGVSLILRVLTGAERALGRDLRHGRVRSITGPIIKEQESAMDVDGTSVCILKVGNQRFIVAAMTFEVAPRSGQVRLYYLPASRKVVNLEALTDGTAPLAPRPLAQALIGSWRNHFAVATFTTDGRVTARVMGRHSAGQWSVDAEGRLHAEIAGRTEIAQASVSGDELRITLTGRLVTLARVVGDPA